MRAIETHYAGYRFRSRLEARWAVFFETAGIPFLYEPEGFNLDGLYYLPDFWLPDQRFWAEIKPETPLDASSVEKVERLAVGEYQAEATREESAERHWVCVLFGSPYADESGPDYEINMYMPWLSPEFTWSSGHCFNDCPRCGAIEISPPASDVGEYQCYSDGEKISLPPGYDPALSTRLRIAYSAARSARFEFGR
jgi:hypothetical protein